MSQVSQSHYDAIIVGAGAAGLMAAITAGRRGRSVLIIEHAQKVGEKIRISGGGRCNFTNIHCKPENFLSDNPRFCRSALARYTPTDFMDMMRTHGLSWHEKTLGQLFCDQKSQAIIDMLVTEVNEADGEIALGTRVDAVQKTDPGFSLETTAGALSCHSLVIASGGLSIPKIGASGFGYDVARQFGLPLVDTRPALVPLTFDEAQKAAMGHLSGLSLDALVARGKTRFREGLLFTHRGLSGPSVLQISSYWRAGEAIMVNLAPEQDVGKALKDAQQAHGGQHVHTALAQHLPARLAEHLTAGAGLAGPLAQTSAKKLSALGARVNQWRVIPTGTEGYRTAEVTAGGVDTRALSSQTMEAREVPGLYFIGEVVDVTGHLGGYNFQWAWASGHAAGQVV